MNARRARLGALASVPVALMALAIAATPVLAYTQISKTGKPGTYSLIDSSDNQSVTCFYASEDEGGYLDHIEVNTVTLWARNHNLTAPGPGQKVGWKLTVQRKKPGGSWKALLSLPTVKSTAWYDQSAYFDTQQAQFMIPVDSQFRVVDTLYWYKKNGTTVAGTVKVRYEYYKQYVEFTGADADALSACYSQHPDV